MNSTGLRGNWNEQKSRLKQKIADITDNDLVFSDVKREEIYSRLRFKHGRSKEELQKK
ncbi:MAG: general stress protein CsbD [Lentimicrobium sp.]|nr:general stress protein CsbD [Lentimicrobium sp.]